MTIHHPIAFCPAHGFFPATGYGMENAEGMRFEGCTTRCPVCGAEAEVLSGRYDAIGDRLNLIVDRSISSDALAALKKLVQDFQSGAISAEEAKAKAATISPKAGKLFDIGAWPPEAKAILYAAVIAGITSIINNRSPSTTVNVQPVIERIIERPPPNLLSSTAIFIPPDLPRPRPNPHGKRR